MPTNFQRQQLPRIGKSTSSIANVINQIQRAKQQLAGQMQCLQNEAVWVEGDKQSGSERGKESDEEQEDAKDKLEDTAVDGSRILARCCLTKNPIYSSHHINVGKITPAEFMASKLPERQNQSVMKHIQRQYNGSLVPREPLLRSAYNQLNSTDPRGKTHVLQGETFKASSMAKNLQVNTEPTGLQRMKDKFKEEFEHIPKPQRSRNEQNLHETIRALQTFNPFFNRIERVICICLLKMGRLLMKARHTTLYKQLESTAHFFIILLGKVKLSSGGLKRVCQTGETLLEEMLFSDKTKKVALEKCKVISGTYLLEIRLEEFDKIREELVRFGYRIPLNEMLSVLKRNYIVKNWLRNRFEEAN